MAHNLYFDMFIKVNERNYLQSTDPKTLWQDFVSGYRVLIHQNGFKLNPKFENNDVVKTDFIKRISAYNLSNK